MNERASFICPQCGHKNDEGTKYCLLCGSLLQPVLQSEIREQTVRRQSGPSPFGQGSMRKVCGNCKKTYIEGDRYCRFCGAPMGTPAYIPEQFACIYGPMPVKRIHTCQSCGYTWDTMQMIDNERFCPICGGRAPATEQDEDAPSEYEDFDLINDPESPILP